MVYVNISDELYHYGVKGMRWGHRKNDPTAYGGSITKSGKYKASNGVVIAKSRNAGVAAGRRFSTSIAGRALSAVGSIGMSKKQRAQLKKQQDALREYQKVGGDKMLKKVSAINKETVRKGESYFASLLEHDPHTTGRLVTLDVVDERTGKKTGTVTTRESKYTEAELRKLEREANRSGRYTKIYV